MSGTKHPNADRSHGGPGSADQDERGVNTTHKSYSKPTAELTGESTNSSYSQESGRSGELDKHHAHDPELNRRHKKA